MRDDRERSAVIANKLAPFEDLSQEAGFYAGEIGLHRYDFNRPRADVDILKQVRAPTRSGRSCSANHCSCRCSSSSTQDCAELRLARVASCGALLSWLRLGPADWAGVGLATLR